MSSQYSGLEEVSSNPYEGLQQVESVPDKIQRTAGKFTKPVTDKLGQFSYGAMETQQAMSDLATGVGNFLGGFLGKEPVENQVEIGNNLPEAKGAAQHILRFAGALATPGAEGVGVLGNAKVLEGGLDAAKNILKYSKPMQDFKNLPAVQKTGKALGDTVQGTLGLVSNGISRAANIAATTPAKIVETLNRKLASLEGLGFHEQIGRDIVERPEMVLKPKEDLIKTMDRVGKYVKDAKSQVGGILGQLRQKAASEYSTIQEDAKPLWDALDNLQQGKPVGVVGEGIEPTLRIQKNDPVMPIINDVLTHLSEELGVETNPQKNIETWQGINEFMKNEALKIENKLREGKALSAGEYVVKNLSEYAKSKLNNLYQKIDDAALKSGITQKSGQYADIMNVIDDFGKLTPKQIGGKLQSHMSTFGAEEYNRLKNILPPNLLVDAVGQILNISKKKAEDLAAAVSTPYAAAHSVARFLVRYPAKASAKFVVPAMKAIGEKVPSGLQQTTTGIGALNQLLKGLQ